MKKWFLIVLLSICIVPVAKSQCAICTKTAAGLDDKSAKGLNGGIIYLAAVPLTILGTLGYVWYRYNKNSI